MGLVFKGLVCAGSKDTTGFGGSGCVGGAGGVLVGGGVAFFARTYAARLFLCVLGGAFGAIAAARAVSGSLSSSSFLIGF